MPYVAANFSNTVLMPATIVSTDMEGVEENLAVACRKVYGKWMKQLGMWL